MLRAGFYVGITFFLLHCASMPDPLPGQDPFDPPLYHTTHWGAMRGTLVADSLQAKQELANPILSHPGSLFVVYKYRKYTLEPSALFVLLGSAQVENLQNSLQEVRAPLQLWCKTKDMELSSDMHPERLSHPLVYISGCLTYVTKIGTQGVELQGSQEDISLGDEYLLFLSPLESNVLTTKNTLRCKVTNNETLHKIQCQFVANEEGYIPHDRPYQHARAVFLQHATLPQSTAPAGDPVLQER